MSASQLLDDLHQAAPLVAPSLLACDLGRLSDEVRRLEEAGVRLLHLDVMDGHFVPNLSFGIPVVEAIRRVTQLPLDVHLMVSEPGHLLEAFRAAGADLLTIHVEAAQRPAELLDQIRQLGAGVGISLNPPTPLEALDGCLEQCDLVLVMSVMPGYCGQQFDPSAVGKLRRLRQSVGPRVLLSIDGGINRQTAGVCAEAGADLFVTGSALFAEDDYARFVREMTELARNGRATRIG